MIYLVSNQLTLFNSTSYEKLSVEASLNLLSSWERIQVDSETTGRNPRLCDFLCIQFGNKKADTQIVVDLTTINIKIYKKLLESKLLILHNGKFDLQFLYKYEIIPRDIWDTMIVEQVLYLGYNYKPMTITEYEKFNYDFPYHDEINDITGQTFRMLSFSLQALVNKYIHINIDKTVRGEIIWRGLDDKVILYSAGDVTYLEDVMEAQKEAIKQKNCALAVKIENKFVPVIAYLEWCGIKLDVNKWKHKMELDQQDLNRSITQLNEWLVQKSSVDSFFSQFFQIDTQGDLFSGFNCTPKVSLNWASQKQMIPIFKHLGFQLEIEDKKTRETKESITEKVLAGQKGIDDDFLRVYLDYKAADKVCSTYGQNYLDAINPITGRIHTVFWQLGASSGRMSCGSKNSDTDLAHYKRLPESACKYVQLQNLPADAITRESFISESGNLFTSADFSALELVKYYI